MFTPQTNNLARKPVRTVKSRKKKTARNHLRDCQPQTFDRRSPEMLEEIGDAFLALDPEWRFVKLNRRAEQLWQKDRQELLGKNIWEEFPETAGTAFERQYRQAVEQRIPVTFEEYYPPLDLWVEVRAFPNRDGLSVYWRDITKYKRTEAALQRCEARNRAFLKVGQECLCSIRQDGTHVEAIAGNEDLLLLPAGELIGKKIQEILPPIIARQWLHFIKQALASETPQIFEYQLSIKGELRMQQARLVKSAGDEVLAVIRDITQRQQTEQLLAKQAQIIDQIHDAAIATDLCGFVTSWNQSAERMYGYSANEAIGKHISFLYPPDRHEFLQHQILEPVMLRGDREVETLTIRKSGEQFWTDISLKLLRDSQGTVIGIIASCNDITERKQAEEILQKREQFLRSIYDGVETSIFVVDVLEDGYFCYVGANPAYERLAGISSERLCGKTPHQFLPSREADALCDRFSECFDSGKTIFYEDSLQFGEANTWWETTITPLRDSQQRIYRLVGTSNNIAERRQAEEARRQNETQLREQARQLERALHQLKTTQTQLVQNEKMSALGQLVAGVAHEINNPVNFIYGNLNYAKDYIQELLQLVTLYIKHYPQPVAEIQQVSEEIDLNFLMVDLPKLFESMRVGAERIRKIVLSLNNFSSVDRDGLKSVNIHEGLDNTLLILQQRLRDRENQPEIKVIADYGKLPSVECYPGLLNQVFLNILSNAIDALEESFYWERNTENYSRQDREPTIWIKTELIKKYSRVAIKIRDNGPGITEEIRSRIFDPFFTTKPVGKGTGLGLAISYKIAIDKHNGFLNCVSEPGEGTEFSIEIPIFRRH